MEDRASSSAVSAVNASATVVTLLAKNTSRRGGSVYNDSSATLYVKLGSAATSTDWTVKLAQDDYYVIPHGYLGIVTGIWASATGQARVTETL